MSTHLVKRFVLTVAACATLTTLVAPQPARAAGGLFDWLTGDDDPPPPPPPGWGRPRPTQPPAPGRPTRPVPRPTAPLEQDPAGPRPDDPETRDGSDKDMAYGEFRNQARVDMPMYLTKTEWTDQDEAKYAQFINRLGLAISQKMCNTVKSCMRSAAANIYAPQDPPGLVLYSDCADFPYFLRTYFAYHNGLPMGHVTSVTISQKPVASEPTRDADLPTARADNSPYGNIIQARGGANTAKAPGAEPNLLTYLGRLFDNVSTRTLRVGPLYPNYDLSDIYPVPVHRGGVRAGAVVHSTGHALVVWNVNQKGIVQVIDAHPDGSVQFKEVKSSTLDRSRPDQGLGFFRFRPLRLVGATQAENGAFYGGRIVPVTDAELYKSGKYSLEQYFGEEANIAPGTQVDVTLWKNAYKKINFFEFLQNRMRMSDVIVKADEEISDVMNGLCNELTQRVSDVDTAITKGGLTQADHPDTLPMSIFSASGPWEDYSTPGRDGRIKASVEDILKQSVSKFRQAKSGDPMMRFDGTAQDYVASLRTRLALMDKKCVVKYTNSKGAKVALTFTQALTRLNRMSFDPYHCAERRWGATGSELASCVDQDRGGAWYDGEKNMRNTVGKQTANEVQVVRSDRPVTLDMLRNPGLIDQPETAQVNLGTATPPIMDLDKNFASDRFLQLLQ